MNKKYKTNNKPENMYITCGRLNLSKLITHRFEGLDKVEDALMLMKDKPKDLIKPVVRIEK